VGRAGLHHVDLVISSLEDSLRLYRELLEPLGYSRAGQTVGERGEPVWYPAGEGVASVGLGRHRRPRPTIATPSGSKLEVVFVP
jgi:catechol 2,3-dioxygenase-like lactoylglutathione lyase family enzyme